MEQKDLIIVCANCGYAQRNDIKLLRSIPQKNNPNVADIAKHFSDMLIKVNICNSSLCETILINALEPFNVQKALSEELSEAEIVRRYGLDPKIRNKFIEKNLKQRSIKNWKNIK